MTWELLRDGAVADPLAPAVRLPRHELRRYALRWDGSVFPVPPADELDSYGGLPLVPDATLLLRYTVVASPVGVVATELELRDGQVARAEVVDHPSTAADLDEVSVAIPWSNHLAWRRGDATLLEALEGSPVEGRWQVLLCAHGLVQQPQWRAALRARPAVR